MVQVSPITTPVPWSMKNDFPIVAPGWMSMPGAAVRHLGQHAR
jgi:hypothetical protein